MREFALPAAVIVKHGNPCGVAVAGSIEEAYERALAADPVSAFGCALVLNRTVSGALGRRIAEHFVEVLLAPAFDDEALEALRAKPALRLLWDRERRMETPGERDYKRVLGGLLVQERDVDVDDRQLMQVVVGTVSEEQWGDLLFAWRVCKHVSSNAIVLAKGLQTIGIGAGQMSRVDAVRIAFEKARELGHDPAGAVLASDAFFPFADGPAARARRGHRGADPAGRLEARRRGDRGGDGRRRGDDPHRPTPLPPLKSRGSTFGSPPRSPSPTLGICRWASTGKARTRGGPFVHSRSRGKSHEAGLLARCRGLGSSVPAPPGA